MWPPSLRFSTIIWPIIAIHTAAALAEHRGGGAEMEAEHEGAGGEADDQRLPHDELRHQAEPHPVMRAGDAVLGVGDDERRQRQAADIERHDRIGVDPRRQRLHHARQQQRDDGGDGERHPAAAGEEAAQQRVLAAGAIFRNDLLRRCRDAEIHHAAEQQHPGPDIDIDAVIRAAHPARQQDLREIGERCADDADDEDRAGQPPGDGGLAGAAKQRAQARDHAGRRERLRIAYPSRPQGCIPETRREAAAMAGCINHSLRFGWVGLVVPGMRSMNQVRHCAPMNLEMSPVRNCARGSAFACAPE